MANEAPSGRKQRLELTWIGKENRPRLEPRILLEDAELSHHAAQRVSDKDIFDNRLIFGDNLLALKALEQEFTGKVKCIYIDPPFNTQQDFLNYSDGMEHSRWLTFMAERIRVMHKLLGSDGTLVVHIDDNELGYLLPLIDEVFLRQNRQFIVTFLQSAATGHKAINPGCVNTTNFLLIYAKDKASWRPKRVFTSRERDPRYGQFILNREEPFPTWRFLPLAKAFAEEKGVTPSKAKKLLSNYEEQLNTFVLGNAASVVRLARPDYDNVSEEARRLIDESDTKPNEILLLERPGYSNMYFVGGQRILFYSDKVKVIDGVPIAGEPLTTLWGDLLSSNLHKEGGVSFPKGKKPEGLIKRVLELTTESGELVLDSFAGSGTTASVAHKMGRQWITVESGEHMFTHVIPRLKAMVNGEDTSGVTEATGWKGGGGFRYFKLAPSLLTLDKFGNHVISEQYNAAMLAEAMCKLMGFRFEPGEVYWQQGRSTETDFLYTTTQTLSRQQLESLSEEVGPKRSLLICCAAFRGKSSDFANITLRKIPMAVLARCEWGKDDYSLNVASLPAAAAEPEPLPETAHADRPPSNPANARKRKTAAKAGPGLFDTGGGED